MRPTAIDERRLRDGAAAFALPVPSSRESVLAQIESLGDAIRALQSLDDLGSPEANKRADDEMLLLQKRRDALRQQLKLDAS